MLAPQPPGCGGGAVLQVAARQLRGPHQRIRGAAAPPLPRARVTRGLPRGAGRAAGLTSPPRPCAQSLAMHHEEVLWAGILHWHQQDVHHKPVILLTKVALVSSSTVDDGLIIPDLADTESGLISFSKIYILCNVIDLISDVIHI